MDHVPIHLFEDQEVVLAAMPEARHACNGDDDPEPQQRATVCQKQLDFFFHLLGFLCKDTKKVKK